MEFSNEHNKQLIYKIIDKLVVNKENRSLEELYNDLINTNFDILSFYNKIKDIEQAGELAYNVISKTNKKILILTDYDCDGINSAFILESAIKHLQMIINPDFTNVTTIINRRKYGNGVNFDSLNKVNLEEYEMLITGDHGSVNEDIYKELKKKYKDLKIIVTDHHQVEYNNYPNNVDYFINPHREDNIYGKKLSGCGVAFMFIINLYISAFRNEQKIKSIYKSEEGLIKEMLYLYGPYVAVTIISDIMDITDNLNRYICKSCFENIHLHYSAILNQIDVKNNLTYQDLSYKIIPLINTANRTHIEDVGLKALNGDIESINKLIINNMDRKNTTDLVIRQAKSSGHIYGKYGKVVVVDTHLAIGGNIAARIGDDYNAPTVCFTIKENSYSGSARAMLDNFDILAILKEMQQEHPDMFITCGGHKGAAGLEIKLDVDILNRFISSFDRKVELALENFEKIDKYIDIDINDISLDLIEDLKKLEPYGNGMEEPLFRSRVKIKNINIWSAVVNFMVEGSDIKCVHYTNKSSNPQFEKLYIFDNEIDIIYKPLLIKKSRGATTLTIKEAHIVR